MERIAAENGIEIEFVRSRKSFRKEDRVKTVLEKRGEHPGVVCILSAMEPRTAATRENARQVAKKAKAAPKAGSKKEIVLGLISRKDGASLEELMAAVDWQKHSVRGFIATLGKTVSIESFKTEQGVRAYKTL